MSRRGGASSRALLTGVIILLSVEGLILRTGAPCSLAPEHPEATLSALPVSPALPGRLASDPPARSAAASVPLPDSLLPERPSLPCFQARSLAAPPASARPADAVHRPAPARGPPSRG